MYKVRNGLAPDYIGELFNFANKRYSLRNADFDIPCYSTIRYMGNTPLGTWAYTSGPNYPQVIVSTSRLSKRERKSRKTHVLISLPRACQSKKKTKKPEAEAQIDRDPCWTILGGTSERETF